MNIKRTQGFSLLEVLLAFTILALSLGVVFEIFARGSQTAILSESYAIASQIAESKLASIPTLDNNGSYKTVGTELEQYDWQLVIKPYYDENSINDSINLYQVTVSVNWQMAGKTKNIQLSSLRYIPVVL